MSNPHDHAGGVTGFDSKVPFDYAQGDICDAIYGLLNCDFMIGKVLGWLSAMIGMPSAPIGLTWLKWALRVALVAAVLFFFVKGFNAVVIEPIVEKRMEPMVLQVTGYKLKVDSLSAADSLKGVVIGDLQRLVLRQRDEHRVYVDSLLTEFKAFNAKRTAEFQGVIRATEDRRRELEEVLGYARTDIGLLTDSLRRSESGLRVDLVTLRFGWLGKLKDSTYTKGYQWPLFHEPIDD